MARSPSSATGLRRLWRDYSLTIVIGTLFLISFVLHVVFGWWQYSADQAANGQAATVFGWDGFVIYFGEWTFQNWQSEFLEVLLIITATVYFVHKGSPESRDGDDEMKATLERIEKRLDELEAGPAPKRKKAA
jgi:hypothetical protein